MIEINHNNSNIATVTKINITRIKIDFILNILKTTVGKLITIAYCIKGKGNLENIMLIY